MADNTENKVVAKLSLDVSTLMDQFKKIQDEFSSLKNDLGKPGGSVYFDDATKGTMNLSQAIKELNLQFKEGQISAQQLYDKLGSLRSQYSQDLNRNMPIGVGNDQMLRNAMVSAQNAVDQAGKTQMRAVEEYVNREIEVEQKYADWLESEKAKQIASDKQHYRALEENAKRDATQRRAIEREYTSWWKQQLAERDNAVKSSFDQQMKLNDTLYQTNRITAQQYYNNLKRLDSSYDSYLNEEANKRIDILKRMYATEEEMAKSNQSAMQKFFSGSGKTNEGMHMNGFGMMNPLDMATMMTSFTVMNQILQNVQQGLVQMDTAQAGLEQVFGTNINSQNQLNQVTDQFIGIAEKYGASVQDVLQAGKQWGRQYHDIATAQTLTNSATLLSIVDNLSMVDSAKKLEATMNALGMSVSNAAEAQKSSMAIVDQWTNMAHNASVSAKDLADGVSVSAGAARQAGLSLAQLNALIAAGVRNSGETGNVIGTMLKTVLAHISSDTPKIQQAFQTLGVSMTDAKGQMKPVYDLLIELSQKSGNLDAAQKKALMTITGGVRQYSRFAQAISNVNTIQSDYKIAMNSSGTATKYAQEQMHTMQAELNRLSASIQQITHDTSSGGLGDFLKSLVVGLTDLINGLDRIPPGVDKMALGFVGLLVTMRLLRGTFGMVERTMNLFKDGAIMSRAVVDTLTAAFNRQGGSLKSYTTMLLEKINMSRADALTTGEQTVANEANTVATEMETGATEGLVGALTAADIAAAAFTLGIGAIIAIATIYTMHVGAAAEKQRELSTATDTTNQKLAQQAQQLQANTQTTTQHVNSIQTLANEYAAAQKALQDNAKGSTKYQQAQQQMMDVERQLIALVGQKAAAQILSSKDVVKAMEDERKTQLEASIAEDQATINKMQLDASHTDQFITNTEKRIKAIQDELYAQSALGAFITGIRAGTSMALNGGADVPKSMMDQQQVPALVKQLNNAKTHVASVQKLMSTAQNSLKQQQLALAELNKNPSAMLSSGVGGTSSPLSSTSPSSKKSKGSSASSYPYQNISSEDTSMLQGYTTALDMLTFAVKSYSSAMSMASTQLKSNSYDTAAASNYTQSYSDEIGSLSKSVKEYESENSKLDQMINQIRNDVSNVNAEYSAGNITAKRHEEALKSLQSEYNKLTGDIKSNASAILQDRQQMVTSTNNMVNEVVSMLQSGYQAEKQIQEQRLQNIYQPQIDALNQQKQAIQDQITALQNLWSMQSNQNTVQQLQKQLAQIKSERNQQVVDANGHLTYTYNVSKAQSVQQQLDKAITKQKHDAEIQRLQDQKTALSNQITNLQNAYNKAKTELDNYWQYRLNQDNLKTEAEAAIMHEGFAQALSDAQRFSNRMNNALAQVQLPDLVKGKNVAHQMGLTNAYDSIGQFVNDANNRFGHLAWPPHKVQNDFAKRMGLDMATSDVRGFVKTVNSELSKVTFPAINVNVNSAVSSLNKLATAAGKAASAMNQKHTTQILNPKYLQYMHDMYNAYHKGESMTSIMKHAPSKYQTVHFEKGGMVPRLDGVPGDHVHAKLAPGEIVVPSFRDLERMTNTSGSNTTLQVSVDKMEFPNVSTADDAQGFINALTEFEHSTFNYVRG